MALSYLQEMEQGDQGADAHGYEAVISVCAKANQWSTILLLIDKMRADGLVPRPYSFNSAIRACAMGSDWERALKLLADFKACGLAPDMFTFNSALRACTKGGQGDHALALLMDMTQYGLSPNSFSFNAAIGACAKGGQWEDVSQLVETMRAQNIKPSLQSYNYAITAVGRAGSWWLVVDLLADMEDAGLVPNSLVISSAVNACAKNRQWKMAHEIMFQYTKMKRDPAALALESSDSREEWELALELTRSYNALGPDLVPYLSTYRAVISTCVVAGEWKKALSLLDDMKAWNVSPDIMTMNILFTALENAHQFDETIKLVKRARGFGLYKDTWFFETEIDLHSCSFAAARSVLRCVFDDIEKQLRPAGYLTLITGSRDRRRTGEVMSDIVREHLYGYGIECTADHHNPGRLLISKGAIQSWLRKFQGGPAAVKW